VTAENRQETQAGQLGEWRWAEGWGLDLYCPDIIRLVSSRLLGLQGVCTSWDSGLLDLAGADLPEWSAKGAHAVSPPITTVMADAWPESSCGFDEWYFFESLPDSTGLEAICNWGVTLADAQELLGLPTGFDLQAQLNVYQPKLVVGDGQRPFVVTRDQAILADVLEECGRRRTRG